MSAEEWVGYTFGAVSSEDFEDYQDVSVCERRSKYHPESFLGRTVKARLELSKTTKELKETNMQTTSDLITKRIVTVTFNSDR